ncbi:FAD-binding oxidoreductase [Flavobacterium sp. xlx-214]|uniref:NAD(P)/FAD-dependent oxidoreductase n=1 Tax=unclassified Flavobacterium TaxID=196869 RepID=UPI0013D60423|nr:MULTISPECIES: FAD-dependent oxidoreductase [unclassified Flavobacterium]MBA5791602.1 FAD-binding oxidoreductase [Flavobacterium sp. xlx-221]QMI82849.1 FAD-binding oxidoreductase [Flavobacterium sp. xlx-214]
MDLYSGLPYWIVKNSLYNYFNPLEKNHKTDVVIIGSGITGALVTHQLCNAGISCTVVDKRSIATGSTAASTAQLQYEVDVPLHKLIKKVGQEHAVAAYKDSLLAIDEIQQVVKSININAGYLKVPTVYYTTNKLGQEMLEKEFQARRKFDLPVDQLLADELFQYQHIKGKYALVNQTSAQIDAYKLAVDIFKYHMENSNLQMFSHTLINVTIPTAEGYELRTSNGCKIKCKYVIIAAGFEAGTFLPKKIMKLESTYAMISEPVHKDQLWPNQSLLWNTDNPYLYMRTTMDNRMIVGGEDVMFENPIKRDLLMREKTETLQRKFKRLYPNIAFKPEMTWCGTFSSTKDGLPYIGAYKTYDKMLFALGYGGNGITFSCIASEMIKNIVLGKKEERLKRYGFDR